MKPYIIIKYINRVRFLGETSWTYEKLSMTSGRGDLRSEEITSEEAERLIRDAGLTLAYTLYNEQGGGVEGKVWDAPDRPFQGIGYYARQEARLGAYRKEYWQNYTK